MRVCLTCSSILCVSLKLVIRFGDFIMTRLNFPESFKKFFFPMCPVNNVVLREGRDQSQNT